MATKRKPKAKAINWTAIRAQIVATPKDVLKKAIQVDGWTIYDPSKFTDAGLSQEIVDAFTKVEKSGNHPKETIFVNSLAVKELKGIYGLDLLEFIASSFNVYSDKNGRGFRAGDLQEKLNKVNFVVQKRS